MREPTGAENSRNLASLHRRPGRRIAIPSPAIHLQISSSRSVHRSPPTRQWAGSVNHTIGKHTPIRLKEENYRELRKHVLQRDGWRCQLCGSMTNLEVHHKQFRSHSGEDDEQNLITLCLNCHSSAHGQDVGPKSGDQGCGEGATQVSELDLQLPWCRSFSELCGAIP